MTKVTYKPTDSEDDITEAFGLVFEAGKSRNVTDEFALGKLRGNPEFQVAGEKPDEKNDTAEDEALTKAVDGRSKAAREARSKAVEADQDASAKERAAEQAKAIQEARAEAEAEKA
jgi:hypothetical protein